IRRRGTPRERVGGGLQGVPRRRCALEVVDLLVAVRPQRAAVADREATEHVRRRARQGAGVVLGSGGGPLALPAPERSAEVGGREEQDALTDARAAVRAAVRAAAGGGAVVVGTRVLQRGN